MNAHQLDAGSVIINTIVVESLDILPNLVDASIGGVIGDKIVGGVLVPKPAHVPTPVEHNAPILVALAAIDSKSIRALREGDAVRTAALEAQAVALRLTLIPIP